MSNLVCSYCKSNNTEIVKQLNKNNDKHYLVKCKLCKKRKYIKSSPAIVNALKDIPWNSKNAHLKQIKLF